MKLKEQEIELSKIVDEIKHTMFRKGNDYANEDRLSNFKLAGNILGLSASQNCLSLIATKVARLGVLIKGNEPNNESIDDSILDLICYSCLLSMIEREKKKPEFTQHESF